MCSTTTKRLKTTKEGCKRHCKETQDNHRHKTTTNRLKTTTKRCKIIQRDTRPPQRYAKPTQRDINRPQRHKTATKKCKTTTERHKMTKITTKRHKLNTNRLKTTTETQNLQKRLNKLIILLKCKLLLPRTRTLNLSLNIFLLILQICPSSLKLSLTLIQVLPLLNFLSITSNVTVLYFIKYKLTHPSVISLLNWAATQSLFWVYTWLHKTTMRVSVGSFTKKFSFWLSAVVTSHNISPPIRRPLQGHPAGPGEVNQSEQRDPGVVDRRPTGHQSGVCQGQNLA